MHWIALATLAVALLTQPGGVGYERRQGRWPKVALPAVPRSSRDIQRLVRGEPVVTMLGGQGQRRAAMLESVVAVDPVTLFMVVTDVRHFSLVDPSFPASGARLGRARTFMPNVRDSAVCVVDGLTHVYRLIVPPLVAPRKESLMRRVDRSAFPWEASWEATRQLHCVDQRNRAYDELHHEAIHVIHNVGAWHVGPVPSELGGPPADGDATHVRLFTDVDLGGAAVPAALLERATRSGLVELMTQVTDHGRSWDAHLRRHHNAEERAAYSRDLANYRARWASTGG